ncbi:conserved hypothetical protein [Candidatus Zixiibacteriota bacterium]|nr:conserved hypothetical protein [candidate division Zixibacteria bacterium]
MPADNGEDRTRSYSVLSKDTLVGHYRIIEKIGSGGMGEVYLAEDTALNRRVALKFLPPHLCQDAECRARFKREAQAAARLDHPNIAAVFEVAEFQDRPFFSMQLVEGQTLRDAMKGEIMPLERIREIGMQICDGLQAAHDSGITHRDIKPSNILIDSHGRARIVDFGLASIIGTEQLTRTGSTLGTIGYMSPEQVKGEKIDHRTDLFSFGVVLYEMITGHAPFKAESDAATFRAITGSHPELLAHFRRDVPSEWQAIIDKALEKNVTLRYQHADDLLLDLKRLAPGPVPLSGEKKSRIRSAYPWMIIAGLILLALILRPWKLEFSRTQETQAAANWLAVMYFDNITDPSDSKRLGEIATNLLITGLSQSEYVKVLSSQRLYDLLKQVGKEGLRTIDRATASQVAEKAQAKWMLTGSILQSDPAIILTSQLVDVSTGAVIASQRVTGNSGENMFAVIDRLTEELKKSDAFPAAIRTESPVKVSDVTTRSPEAYRYYLEGLDYWNKLYGDDCRRSMRKAIQFDSTFADAYAMLALSLGAGSEEAEAAIAKAAKYIDRADERNRRRIIAIQLYIKKDYKNAIAATREVLRIDPDDKQTWVGLGEIYTMDGWQKNIDSIIMCANRALALDPNFRMAYNLLAYSMERSGRQKEAIDAINRYIKLAPGEANPYDTRGDLYAETGNIDSALESYRKALAIKPDFLESLKKTGFMYMFKERYQQAESCYHAYISNLPRKQRGYWRASLTYIPSFRGRFREGLRIADECISANKIDGMENTNWVLYTLKSDMYNYLGRPDSALAMIKMAMAIEDKERQHESGLESWQAVMYLKTGDTASANLLVARLERVAQSENDFDIEEYWSARGMIALELGDYTAAIEYLGKHDSLSEGMIGNDLLAKACLYAGNYKRAAEMLEIMQTKYSENNAISGAHFVEGYYWLGRAYDEMGKKDKARANLEKFLSIWKDADPGLKEVEDAGARLSKLRVG